MTRENKNFSETSKLVSTGMFLGMGLGALALVPQYISGLDRVEKNFRPASAVYSDVNKDARNDIVFRTKDGSEYTFYGQDDGTYLSLDEICAKADSALEDSIRNQYEMK